MKNKDEVRLIIGGYEISSWTGVEVYQGMESLPNGAILELAELYREDREVTAITPGDYVEIRLGDDALIKGYVDEYRIAMSSGNRSASLSIRG
ncbi:phage baseplate assembly protein, partial [Sinorhizobium meliloti]|uniref:phage baseplate assembly protein n=1 Tax=Rhizobium meliloti TaxID=382 RepID=UPI0030B77551